MRVVKCGNAFAVGLRAAVVRALELKRGEEVELYVVRDHAVEVARKAQPQALLARLHRLRRRLPADFRFDRLEADRRDRRS